MFVGLIWANAFVAPTLAIEAPAVPDAEPAGTPAFGFLLSTTIFDLSWALFGVAMLRARAYPRVAPILLIIGALLVIVLPLPATGFVIEVALIWLGVICLKARDARLLLGRSGPRPDRGYSSRDAKRGRRVCNLRYPLRVER